MPDSQQGYHVVPIGFLAYQSLDSLLYEAIHIL